MPAKRLALVSVSLLISLSGLLSAEPFRETPDIVIEPEFCSLYPLTVHDSLLAQASPGQSFDGVKLGTGPGNYSWLTWSGTNSAPDQEARLIPPGNSNRYRSPNDTSDIQLNAGDWVEGTPGVKNASGIRSRVDALLAQNIIIPLYSSYEAQGANLNYKVSDFAVIRLTDYQLNGKGYISFDFVRKTRCYNHRPVAEDLLIELPEDTQLTFELPGTDADADTLLVSAHSDVTNGKLEVDPATRLATYTPGPDYFGNDGFQFTLHDNEQLSNTATVTINVLPVNDAPVAQNTVVEGLEDTLIPLVFNASDIDSTDLQLTPDLLSAPGQLVQNDSNYFYQPPADFFGTVELAYRAFDGELYSNTAGITVHVQPVNDAPVVSDAEYELEMDTSQIFVPTVSDIDSTDYQLVSVAAPANGSIDINGEEVTYTPDVGFVGTDVWQYQADDLADGPNDAGTRLSNVGTIHFNVIKINEPPVIVSEPIDVTPEQQAYQYQVVVEDPNELDVIDYALTFAPDLMTIDSSGNISWQPDASWTQSVPTFNKQCYVVPTGSAKIYEDGDEDNALAYVAPMFQQVKASLEKASEYTGQRTVAWDQRNRCLGCHVQTQTLLGLQASMDKADVDLESAEFLLNEILTSQQADGSIRQSHAGYSKTQTAFALWSLSYVPDRERTLVERARALEFMMNRQINSGGEIYWRQDHNSGWLRNYDAITSLVALSGARFLTDVSRSEQSSDELTQIADRVKTRLPGITQFFLNRAYQNSNETQWLAFRLIALSELETVTESQSVLAELQAATTWLDNELRSRQLSTGGWSRYSHSTTGDPLTTAWVGLALNYGDPALTDPVVTNTIEYLLDTQSANGTWVTTSGLFNTHLATTSLVMAYLPVALEHLGNPDVSAGSIHLVEGDDGVHQLTAKVINRGLADITAPLTVTFYNGADAGLELGQVQLSGLLSGETRKATISVNDTDLSDHVYVSISSAADNDECEITNNKSHAALVRVRVADPDNESDSQVYTLNVLDVNETPVIVSDAPTEHQGGQGLNYVVQVVDGDEADGHSFRLIDAPENVYIDPNSGVMTAAPGVLPPGDYSVVVEVTDLRGATTTQTVTFTVYANEAPQIVSVAISEGSEAAGYAYDVDAIDANGDTLEYALERFPQGSWIDKPSGLLNWVGNADHVESTTASNEFCVGQPVMQWSDAAPVVKWSMAGQISSSAVFGPVNVAQMTDDNNDGVIDDNDKSDVIFAVQSPTALAVADGETGTLHWIRTGLGNTSLGSTAVADTDNDGVPEIYIVNSNRSQLLKISHQGELIWSAATGLPTMSGPRDGVAIADLQGDGIAEIVVGRSVFTPDGVRLWSGSGDFGGDTRYGLNPVIGDVDLDGIQEVIAGRTIYSADGEIKAQAGSITSDGFTALGNFDDDDFAEIVTVGNSRVSLYNHDGSVIWENRYISGGGYGGSPTIGDFDGDGLPEIGVAGGRNYVVFEHDGTVKWMSPTRDSSSHRTGSSLFDFNSDGQTEVVYADEYFFRVYDGSTGDVLIEEANRSGTTLEYPVIADIDNDGHAEILIGSSATSGKLRALEAADDDWAPTRALWNQHAYHINNINDDLTIPVDPQASWLTHNTFRLNTFPDRPALGLADLTVHNIRYNEATQSLSADVVNRGLAPVTLPVTVRFTHQHSWSGETVLGEVSLDALKMNETRTVSLAVADPAALEQTVRVELVPDSRTAECLVDNNQAQAVVFEASVYDEAGERDTQLFVASLQNNNDEPSITGSASSSFAESTAFSFTVEVVDPDVGDDHRFELIDAPAGVTIGEITGTVESEGLSLGAYPLTVRAYDLAGAMDEQIHLLTIVVPDNVAPEITSEPVTSVTVGDTYSYAVQAVDADGDAIQFFLSRTQPGMAIDADTGLLLWTPTENDLGLKSVEVTVVDEQGAMSKQYFLIDVLEPNVTNTPPQITSVPEGLVIAGQTFTYPVIAADADNDPLSYSVVSDVDVITIDDQGLMSWLPTSDLIGQAVVVEVLVDDGRGGVASQKMTLPVNDAANNPPRITSVPDLSVNAEERYEYAISGEDIDGDSIRFELLEGPDGMTLTGALIEWTPASVQVGQIADVIVKATDSRGAASTQSFGIAVNEELPFNSVPQILSTPTSPAVVGETYTYTLVATDAENDDLTYSIDSPIAGTSISPEGVFSWQPATDQVGTHRITLRVSDGRAWVTQAYTLDVIEPVEPDENGNLNQPPVISSTPRTEAAVGNNYQYQLIASDADGDTLVYDALDLPENASISDSGLMSWTPGVDQTGLHDVVLTVDDGQIRALQSFSIVVFDEPLPIDVFISVEPQNPNFGDLVDVQVLANGGVDHLSKTLTVNGVEYPMDAFGRASILANSYGVNEIVATVTDGVETVVESSWFSVIDPQDTAAPIVTLHSPVDDQVVTEPTDVLASITDDNLREWQLIVKEKGTAATDYQVIASGNSDVTNDIVGVFDPTLLSNGQYALILTAEDTNGLSAQTGVSVLVEGDFKVGNFGVTFEDLNVPVAGVPIRITRTYDSRQRHERLDFGYGWSVGYQDVKVHESRTPGKFWTLNEYSGAFGIIPNYCVEPQGAPVVTITLPDGSVEKFEMAASPRCNTAIPITDVSVVFNAVGDTQSKLEALDDTTAKLIQGNLVETGYFSTPVDPDRYKLTTQAGYEYYLHQQTGVERIVDPNGHTLTFTHDGILHSSGKSIEFVRNAYGQIEQVIDPAGNVLDYQYDANGDLTNARDAAAVEQNAEGSRYTYLGRTHGLDEMFDPLGRRVIKNVYDDAGRLDYQIDGDGNLITFDHDLEGRISTVTDREGRTKVFAYDEQGNVLDEIQKAQGIVYFDDIESSYAYDANGNQTRSAVGGDEFATTADFDSSNNQTSATNALGQTVFYRDYNEKGQEGEIEDELGRVHNLHYDFIGNLYRIEGPEYVDPETGETKRNTAGSIINSRGLVTSTTDMNGTETTYTYYGKDHVWADQKKTESTELGGTTTYTYDDNLNVKTETRERTVNGVIVEETVSYDYDAQNRVTKTTYPDGSFSETVYDLAGNAVEERDRFGVWTEHEFDAYGRTLATYYADGTRETWTYTAEGNVETHISRSGLETAYEYDDFGRQWKVHNRTEALATGQPSYTETQYTPQGWVQYEWDAERNLTEYQYNEAGQRTKVIRHDGNGNTFEHSFTYYANGELESETDANGHTTTYELNEQDQRVKTLYQDGTETEARYDAMGTRTHAVDQNDRSTRFGYDALGRLLEVQPEVQVELDGFLVDVPATRYGYDEVGNKLTQTDANDHTTTWTYDYFGRTVSRTLPEGQQESTAYSTQACSTPAYTGYGDDLCQVITHTDFKGQVTTTVMDQLGRTERIDYHDGSFKVYDYYAGGQVRSITTEQGTVSYTYDAADRLATETQADGSVLSYEYDRNGNRTRLTVSRNGTDTVTDFSYDGLNRLSTVTDATGTTTYTYDAVGNLDTVTAPNGNVTDYDYSEVNQLWQLTITNASNQTLSHYVYDLDNTGRRTNITENHSGRTIINQYDALYRLTGETITDPMNGDYTARYQYDLVGNRTYETVDGVQTAYSYNDNDWLLQTGGSLFGYDDNGNTISETLDGLTTVYRYNAQNQLVETDSQGDITQYRYNPNGIRIGKTERVGQLDEVDTHYLVDENRDYAQVLQEAENGNVTVTYQYGHDLLSQTRTDTNETRFFQVDGLGSTRQLTDETGQITDTFNYEAFGTVLNQTGETENSYLYTGEQYDAGLDQYYLRARYYDQNVGRFTQMDTWMGNNHDPITLHKYLYANVDPVTYTDPTGNFSLGGMMSSIGTMASLASRAHTAYSIFQIATGEEELSARQLGTAIIFSRLPTKLAGKLISKTCKRNSFVGDTLISTESGLVQISEIKLGDLVWSYNADTENYELQEIIHLISGTGLYDLVEIRLDNGEEISTTTGHPFYVVELDTWQDAIDLRSGYSLLTLSGETLKIESINIGTASLSVFNLTVSHSHTYFAGKSSVLNHNCRPKEIRIPLHSYESARKKALDLLGPINHANRTKIIGRLSTSKGYGKVVGFETKVDGVWKQYRIDFDPVKGPHINVKVGKGKDMVVNHSIEFPGSEKDFEKLLTQLN